MAKRAIQKSIRLNPDTLDNIESFMESARVMSEEEENGKKTLSNNLTKAFHYLTRSFYDNRRFTDRALFDGTLRDLESLTSDLIKTGNALNDLNKTYFSNSSSRTAPDAVISELNALFDQNIRSLDLFASAFTLDKNGKT